MKWRLEVRRESRELDTRGEQVEVTKRLYNTVLKNSQRAQAMFIGSKSTTTKEGATIFEVRSFAI